MMEKVRKFLSVLKTVGRTFKAKFDRKYALRFYLYLMNFLKLQKMLCMKQVEDAYENSIQKLAARYGKCLNVGRN